MTRHDPQDRARMADVMERMNAEQIWRDELDDLTVKGARWAILFAAIFAVVLILTIGRALSQAAYDDVNLYRDAAAHGFDLRGK